MAYELPNASRPAASIAVISAGLIDPVTYQGHCPS
jgi:hypothetical protein